MTNPSSDAQAARCPVRTLSAGIVLVRQCAGEPRYLLLRAYRYWDFPKGEVRPGEDPLAGAIRELGEETGLRDLAFPWGRGFRETPVYGRGKVARYYLSRYQGGEVRLGLDPDLGRPEHHEFRWMSYAEARARLADRVKPVLDWVHAKVAPQSQKS